ncbi:DNA cytosine methyltransferase [Clostridium sp. 'White wine YQ']|uniref:DNA cytosine methyltransferase n=1 Tax=Clostridium sp. 'White wine YQ' TaxID=3027474 RepID=UPI0023654F90|nr:DNA cytosine methyltransferase [Clostridium sp. 'White wine YQ']MDD7794358.1 DNA cytosine methyltransferase [Clostridium sp. 'White wine YQ']
MKVADFFCGGGGFSEGFRQAGFDVVFAVDKWEPAVITHKANHPKCKTIKMDIIELSNLPDKEFHEKIPDTEIIIGSPPCVAFSSSNKSGKGDKTMGIKLIKAFLKIVYRKKYKKDSILKYWILENVPNAQKYIKEYYTSEELGISGGSERLQIFKESTNVYAALDYAAPTKRKRFICGDFITPKKIIIDNEKLTLGYILKTLGEPCTRDRLVKDPNWNFKMKSSLISDLNYISEVADFEWKKAKRLKQDKGYMGKMAFPERLDQPARTIMATMSTSSRESFILGYKEGSFRLPTVREVATIMSFPIDYRFYGKSESIKYKLVGNAVPPKFSYALGIAIANEENMKIPEKHVKIKHDKSISFTDLNFKIIPLNKEKRKKITSKFKYHIPYMIINTYRVELTNHNSDFKNENFIWNTEIHKSQGSTAKIIRIDKEDIILENKLIDKINKLVLDIKNKVVSFDNLQYNFTLTDFERDYNSWGPYEVLDSIKIFIDNQIDNIELNRMIQIKEEKIPFGTLVGYYILLEFLEKLKG